MEKNRTIIAPARTRQHFEREKHKEKKKLERNTQRKKERNQERNKGRSNYRNESKKERVNYALLIGKATSKNQYLAVLKAAIQHLSKIGNLCYVRRRAGKLATRSVIISFLLSTTASGV